MNDIRGKINLVVNKTILDNLLDIAEMTSDKELIGAILCSAEIENNILLMRYKRFINLKNISPTPEISAIPEVDEKTLRVILGYDTASIVHSHVHCRDPSLGDFSKYTVRKHIYKEGPQPHLIIVTPDVIVTKCFLAFVLLSPFSVILDIVGKGAKFNSEKFETRFLPIQDIDPSDIERINTLSQYIVLPLPRLKDIYRDFNFKWKWKFDPEKYHQKEINDNGYGTINDAEIAPEKSVVPKNLKGPHKNVGNIEYDPGKEIELSLEKRRYVPRNIHGAVRDNSFRYRILNVYKDKCAICGLQMSMVEACHIIPVEDDGTDEIINGIALCHNHHKAFDSGLIWINEEYNIMLNHSKIKDIKDTNIAGGLDDFIKNSRIGEKIFLPDNDKFYPGLNYLAKKRDTIFK